jgi:hypothetical protein
MKKLQLIDYILIVEGIALVLMLGYVFTRPPAKCIESLDVTKGQNFNQPILTMHNCYAGQVPTNWRDFEAK